MRPPAHGGAGDRLRRGAASLAVLLLALGLGCKGKEEGDDLLPCNAIAFAPALASPAAGDVSLQSSSGSCDSVDISVVVTDLSGIFTVGFEVTYPASVIAYQSFSAGPLLQQGSPQIQPQFFITNSSPGDLVVSGTRFRPDASVSAFGSVTLITFHFTKVATGLADIDFNTGPGASINNQIIDEDGNVAAASFGPGHGGTVLVP